ncbi:hypothetical protein [Elioraea sp.]|uniref:hypothetical protein n=1 Tax=Elioraea sp. TaxID=2185103 RepID=UPI0025BE3053|nr:hypothetical protein [Elioraea sp.]
MGLVSLAAEAEAIRLKRAFSIQARAFAWRAGAAGFGVAAIALLHVAAWHALVPSLGLVTAALAIAVADAVVALLLAFIARTRYDPVVEEAAALRRALLRRAIRDVARAPLISAGALLADTALAVIRRR